MNRRVRSGFTLIELVVVIAIVTILGLLIIPAVQSSREAGRRTLCANRLKQIGVATESYITTHGVFPPTVGPLGFPPHLRLLPYLEQRALYDRFNFEVDPNLDSGASNWTAGGAFVGVYLCPSDGVAAEFPGRTNYAVCEGNGRDPRSAIEDHPNCRGLYGRQIAAIGPDAVTDGLSQTVAVSEILVGAVPILDSVRYRTMAQFRFEGDFDAFVAQCHRVNFPDLPGLLRLNHRGIRWSEPGIYTTSYNHAIGVNGNSCDSNPGVWIANTANSLHPGGVNSLFGDGHVRFVPDGTNLEVWRSIATRSGGEVVSDDLR